MDSAISVESVAVMPVEPDWNSVQARYLEGDDLSAIAVDNNTTVAAISTRAWRYHWKELQFKLLEKNAREVEREVRGCITVSVLKEARAFQRDDIPPIGPDRDTFNRCRLRLLETAGKLFGWDADPVAAAKPAKCLDV